MDSKNRQREKKDRPESYSYDHACHSATGGLEWGKTGPEHGNLTKTDD